MALSVSYRVGTKISVPYTHRSDPRMGPWGNTIHIQLCRLWSNTTQCSTRSCAPDRDGSSESLNIGFHGTAEGAEFDQIIQEIQRTSKKPYWGNHFWAKGYCVDTIGLDAEMIEKYVKYQEQKERYLEQLELTL